VRLIDWGLNALAGELERVIVEFSYRAVFTVIAQDGLRLFVKVDEGDTRFQREMVALGALGALAATGLAPAVRLARCDGGRSLLALEEVAGSPLVESDDPGAWRAAGAALRCVHDVALPDGVQPFGSPDLDWTTFLHWWVDHYCDGLVADSLLSRDASERLRPRMDEAFGAMQEPRRVLLHGDCQPAHVFFDPPSGRVTGLIDFVDAGSGDPVWDLAVLTLEHRHRVPDVLAGYEPTATDQAVLDVALPAYWVLRHLGSAGWMAEHGFDPQPDLRGALALL